LQSNSRLDSSFRWNDGNEVCGDYLNSVAASPHAHTDPYRGRRDAVVVRRNVKPDASLRWGDGRTVCRL